MRSSNHPVKPNLRSVRSAKDIKLSRSHAPIDLQPVEWQRALRRVYLPGQYLSRVKRPGAQYVRRMILPEDFAFWVLSSVFIAPNPVTHVIGRGGRRPGMEQHGYQRPARTSSDGCGARGTGPSALAR